MADDNPPQEVDRFARGLIRRKAKQIIGRAGITAQDRDDLEQELILGLLKRRRSYDPRRGRSTTFSRLAVAHTLANLLRANAAKKRATGKITSLSQQVTTGDGVRTELGQTLAEGNEDKHRGPFRRAPDEVADLAQDLAEVVEQLPARLRDLAQRLKIDSLAQVARDLGKPRSTVASWVRELRQRFEKAGLRDYL
jgi:RNA polymerase sigma-70 factor (ECF subfamily)